MDITRSIQVSRDWSRPASSLIGRRIRQLREQKGLSQRDVEERSGLLKCYISRVENGYKLPSLRTLERFASALEVSLYRLFYDGEETSPADLNLRAAFEDPPAIEDKGGHYARFIQ